MSEQFSPGEWVAALYSRTKLAIKRGDLFRVVKCVNGTVKIGGTEHESRTYSALFFRKATKEEIDSRLINKSDMSTKRRFVQAVCMRINREQYEADIQKWAEEVMFRNASDDYRPKRFEEYPFLAANVSNMPLMLCHDENLLCNPYRIKGYNPDLFKALAAMSDGEKFWPGEWIIFNNNVASRPVKFIEYVEPESDIDDKMNVLDEEEKQWQWVSSYRKSTIEELIAHFSKNEKQPDKAEKIGEAVPYLGVLYRNNKNKRLYDVLHLAEDANTSQPLGTSVVVYKQRSNGKVYVRNLSEFEQKFTEVHEPTIDQLVAAFANAHKLNKDQVIIEGLNLPENYFT